MFLYGFRANLRSGHLHGVLAGWAVHSHRHQTNRSRCSVSVTLSRKQKQTVRAGLQVVTPDHPLAIALQVATTFAPQAHYTVTDHAPQACMQKAAVWTLTCASSSFQHNVAIVADGFAGEAIL